MKKRKIIILSIILAVIVCFLGVIIINKVKNKSSYNENSIEYTIIKEFDIRIII